MNFKEWQKGGMDIHSLVADPMFVDLKNDDFRLKPDSPAFKLGFHPLKIEKCGPQTKSRLLITPDNVDRAFYVAPDGNDDGDGSLKLPFASLDRARNAVRAVTMPDGEKRNIKDITVGVFLREGRYFLQQPFQLFPEDSGTQIAPVIYAAYPGEKPVLSGGRQIDGWSETKLNGKKMWVASLPEVKKKKWFFRELWVNGNRAVRTRYPKKDYLMVADTDLTGDFHQPEYGQTSFRFFRDNIPFFEQKAGAEIMMFSRWRESRLPIKEINWKVRRIHTTQKAYTVLLPYDRFHIENVIEFLTEPGEWFMDKKAGLIYYIPRQNETISEINAIGPVLDCVLKLSGQPQNASFIEYVNFQELTFSHGEFNLPDAQTGCIQGANDVRGLIRGEGVNQVCFEQCAIVNTGGYGIELGRGCRNNIITHCSLTDLGGGGIRIGEKVDRFENRDEQTFDNEVSHCEIANGGRYFQSAVGILILRSRKNRILHNHIHDFYYSGISVGWDWTPNYALTHHNIVEYNLIHHIGQLANGDGPILSDLGAIYLLGCQPGTVVRHNHIHDIRAARYGAKGIYLDESCCHILVERNLAYRSQDSVCSMKGMGNIFRNNIFAYGGNCQLRTSTLLEKHLALTFEQNIIIWRDAQLFISRDMECNLRELRKKIQINNNLYMQEDSDCIYFGSKPFCTVKDLNQFWQDEEHTFRVIEDDYDTVVNFPDIWRFRLDPENSGEKLGYFKSDFNDGNWDSIRIRDWWNGQGEDYKNYFDKLAWYRINFDVPDTLYGSSAILVFGAADSITNVYLNGDHIGKRNPFEGSWDKRFSFDVTNYLLYGKRNTLAVSVTGVKAKFGGIWKGVRLVTPTGNNNPEVCKVINFK